MNAIYGLCLVATLFYLVSSCEKQTHYEKDGNCCKKCGPGKRMLQNDACDDPSCQDCLEGEYQSGYTNEIKCSPQPSCDTNLHFEPQMTPTPKDKISKCQCKSGYFCTEDDDCSTCRKHKVCSAGQKIGKKGSGVSNTVCETCKNGTFSINGSSLTCTEWTTCESGFVEKSPGSLTSDRICEKGTPSERSAILGAALAFVLLLVAGSVVAYFIRKRTFTWRPIQKDVVEPIRINIFPDNEPTGDEMRCNQQPQEDLDNSAPVSPTSNVTENGNLLVQENGKPSICPSTETQPFSQDISMLYPST